MKYNSKFKPSKPSRYDEDADEVAISPQYLEYVERSIAISQVTLYIDEAVKEPRYYRKVADRITNLSSNDEVRFFVNSPGGSLSGLVTLLDALEQTEANSVAIISGEAHSAAGILALNCNEVHVSPYATMLVHSVQFGSVGKGADVRDQVKHTLDYSDSIFRSTYEGFLTEQEMLEVLNGRELWLVSEDIIARLENKIAFLATKLEAVEVAEIVEVATEVKTKRKPKVKATE